MSASTRLVILLATCVLGAGVHAQPVMQVEGRCSISASNDVGEAPCADLRVRDPAGVLATTSRDPAFVDAYVEATGSASPGAVGIQAVARVVPQSGFYTSSNAYVFAQSNETLQVVSTDPVGTRSSALLRSTVDWTTFTRWGGESDDYSSGNYTSFSAYAYIYSYSRYGQSIDTVQAYFNNETRSPADGSVEIVATTTFADSFLIESGGSFRVSIGMSAYVAASAGLASPTGILFPDRTEARIGAMNSQHVYLDALNDNFTLVSSSGHDYAAPVPELPSPVLLAAGLLGLAGCRQGRRQGACRG